MRLSILFLLLTTASFALDPTLYFNKSKENRLLCHIGQYSFKVISQKNAQIIKMHNHVFFKLSDENLYFLSNACQPLQEKEGVIF